jgi:uncharacterized protein YqjF (DUF2071 family)
MLRPQISRRGEACLALSSPASTFTPLFSCSWQRALFLHYRVTPHILQKQIPFDLDLYDNTAYVSLVGFTLRNLRINHPHLGWLTHPLHTHDFLNVRTYVRHGHLRGIYFLAEWLNNRLASMLGPLLYGLPYRFGSITYSLDSLRLRGEIRGGMGSGTPMPVRATFRYSATLPTDPTYQPCTPGTLDEFLMERYIAFTKHGPFRRFFHVSHTPWPQTPLHANILDDSLLHTTGPWFPHAEFISANFSPGVTVQMGRPQRL